MPEISTATDTPAEVTYFNTPGLSNSGMKDLAVSPLRYWHLHVNPDRKLVEPTPQMIFGSALHCAFLEGETKFDQRYARELDQADFENLLVTVDDIRAFIRDKGFTPSGTKKEVLIGQAQGIDPQVRIWSDMESLHEIMHAGKTLISSDDWTRLQGCLTALRQGPVVMSIMESGEPEVPLFVKDEESGVNLKAKLDWVTPKLTLDLKTFVQMRGKSIDKSVADAIWYENYHRQAALYSRIRQIKRHGFMDGPGGKKKMPDFVMVFVESEPPHEVRIKAIRPTTAGQPNMYWMRANSEINSLIWRYAEYTKRFGDKPWIEGQAIEPLMDEELPGLAY